MEVVALGTVTIGERPGAIDHIDGWMNLEDLAAVELTSEAPEFPIKGAVTLNGQAGWRVAEPGVQNPAALSIGP